MAWPKWWEWELELSSHLETRMEERGITEVELRSMLGQATEYERDLIQDRWVIRTRHGTRRWEVIVEPDPLEEVLVVITAYPVSG